jgi:hypothetical protein
MLAGHTRTWARPALLIRPCTGAELPETIRYSAACKPLLLIQRQAIPRGVVVEALECQILAEDEPLAFS